MGVEVIGWMLRFGLDGQLLRASGSRFLEGASVPFLREVIVVCRRGLVGAIVHPAGVWFSYGRDGQ